MAETTRSEIRRLDAEQNRSYKRSFIATIFVVVSLILFSFTLMNPSFMKELLGQVMGKQWLMHKLMQNLIAWQC